MRDKKIKKFLCLPHTLVCGLFEFLDDPKFKTLKLRPHSKECGFKFMDINRLKIKKTKYLQCFFAVIVLLNLTLLLAGNFYYEVEISYQNKIMNIESANIKPYDWKMENFYKPYQFSENSIKVIDFEERTVQEEKFSAPFFGVYDTVDENGEINGGGTIESDNFTFYLYIPYKENAKEIAIYDSFGKEIARKDVGEYSRVSVSSEKESEDIEDKENLYLDRFKENTKKYWIWLAVLVVVLIVGYYLFLRKKSRR